MNQIAQVFHENRSLKLQLNEQRRRIHFRLYDTQSKLYDNHAAKYPQVKKNWSRSLMKIINKSVILKSPEYLGWDVEFQF